jgi:Predicted small secreted protein|nr:entericidin A/B family lipoprotein [Citrobacter rodentium]
MKRLLGFATLLFLVTALLSGCNTARGFGEDVRHLGNAISRAAS